jgi:hypothetical protein
VAKQELLAISDVVVCLRLHSNGHGCGASALRRQVEDAIYATAPDLSSLSIKGAEEVAASAIVPLEQLLSVPQSAAYEARRDRAPVRRS